ncbi:hypothetical protein DFH07DRAFT_691613, partial [Mycena maculata]
DHTVSESVVAGATLALYSMPSLTHVRHIFIRIDSQSVICALLHLRQQPGQYLLLEFQHELEHLTHRAPNIQFHIGWVPGNVDFPPNKQVDSKAKLAAQNSDSPHLHAPLPRSSSTAKATFK